MDFIDGIIRENDYLLSQRQQWDTQWQSLADYELPSMADFTVGLSPGQRRGTKIINSTGLLAARECAVRVNGFLTGDGSNWFDLRIPDAKIENDPAVRGWLDLVKRVGYSVFHSPDSGFGTMKEPTYKQLCVFGNAPIYVGETAAGWPKFRPEFLGNCSIWTDDDNIPVALFREYKQTAWGLEKQFGAANLPDMVKTALEKEPQKEFSCIHAVRPRMDSDPFDLAQKPWIEAYVLKDGKHLLDKVSGYWEFPWLFPRWNVSPNESYGRGPGEDALPDVKALQQMDKHIMKHVHMDVDPQWLTEDESGVSPRINQNPGGMIYGRMNPQGHWNVQRLGPGGSASDGIELMNAKEAKVKSLFYLDAFKMVEKISESGSVVHMSATEFAGRQAEQMRNAGPALERMRAEFLFPMVNRLFSILIRNGKVPPPPRQLRGAPIYPEYVSPLAIAQRSGERSEVLQLIGDIIPLAQIDPRAMDFINVSRAGKVLARALHVPQEALNTDDEIRALEKARADAVDQKTQMEQLAIGSEASKNSAAAIGMLREAP